MGEEMNEEKILQKFRSEKVLTIEQLTHLLSCSVITVRRRLKQWSVHTSLNKNGRYYVLPKVAEFDRNGLWNHQGIFFSKHGNLKKTIIQLIRQSETGLSAHEISKLVGIAPDSSFISHFRNFPGIQREKYTGRFIYFSDDPNVYKKQVFVRLGAIKFPSDADAVLILVQFIKHPNISLKELSNKIAQQGKRIESAVIRSFLEYHGLLKKTPATRR
jgi:hypothetical protein